MLPRVSVIIPVYNSAAYLRQALDSVVSQSHPEIELIVVDDGSTDSSRIIVRDYPSAKLLEQDHQGACRARNFGLTQASGDFIKFLDSDDLLESDILEKQVEFLRHHTATVIVYSDIIFFDDDNGRTRMDIVDLSPERSQVLQLMKRNIQTSSPLYRRSALLQLNGFDERLLRAQEYNLHLRLCLSGHVFMRLPCVSTRVREHAAPHRISNQTPDRTTRENSELRNELYLEMFRAHYGDAIPSEIIREFVAGAVETAIVKLRNGDHEGARYSLSGLSRFEPGVTNLLAGGAMAIGRISRNKWRALGGLGRRIFSRKLLRKP